MRYRISGRRPTAPARLGIARLRLAVLAAGCVALAGTAAMAQSKYPGTTLSPTPAPVAPIARPVAPPVAQAAPATPETNAAATRLADSLPLDATTRDLRNRLPADPHAVERKLGLREPHGTRVDMRGRTPTPKEIVDALAH
jgi:hypothetical protein